MLRDALPRGRVLVLAPHPDDETFGCGGTLALHRDEGDPVRVLVLTDGAAGDPAGHYPAAEYVGIRQAEARRACGLLGIADLDFWRLADGKLADVADLPARLAEAIGPYRADILYYPSSLELHPDHWAAGLAVEALHASGQLPCAAYGYEIWSALQPTHLVDVTRALARKEAAMAEYVSQLRYHDYRSQILGLNRYRSISVFAEARPVEAFRRLAKHSVE
jgi:LmbE family N-acetylglucosaminyl deacetylase